MIQQQIGLISPRDRKTAVLQDQLPESTDAGLVLFEGNRISLGDYLSRFPATAFITFSRNDELEEAHHRFENQAYAIDFALMLFDHKLSDKLKQDVARELDELLESPDNEEYVLDILLAHPMPDKTDFEAVKTPTSDFPRANALIDRLADCQKRVTFAYKSWLAVRTHPIVNQTGMSTVQGNLIYSGVWRKLVTDVATKDDVRTAKGLLVVGAQSFCDPRIVTAFIDEYCQFLPGEPSSRSEIVTLNAGATLPEEDGFAGARRGISAIGMRQRYADNEQERAVREVETIASLYVAGDDQQADQYFTELVARQSQEANLTFVVKSLCNIASKCTTGGRPDMAAKCLTKAAQFPNGIDSRLYVQMGNLFKDLKKHDEAVNSFQRAKNLAGNSDELDSINRELARLLTARGEYSTAFEAFQQLSDIDSSPQSRTSMATVLRKMGRVPDARAIYQDVWSQYHDYHQAFAGLAEANRHTGRFDKAIIKYKYLVRMVNDDERSLKVYRLALSSLLCVTGRVKQSQSLLGELRNQFPMDSSLQLAMARVLRLRGDTQQADELYQRSFERLDQTEQLAARLYETARMEDVQGTPSTGVDVIVMPELKGLLGCSNRLRKIIAGDYVGALKECENQNHVYRLHSDFDAVLQYHARVLCDCQTNPKNDVAVNRLRKRGLRQLRLAVRAVDRCDFPEAVAFEQQLCLMMA